MLYNLRDAQKNVLKWIVQRVRDGSMPDEFWVTWTAGGLSLVVMRTGGETPRRQLDRES